MAGLLQQGMAPQAQPTPQAQPGQQPPQQSPQQPQQGGNVDMDPQQGPQQRQMLVEGMLDALYGPMLEQARTILQQHAEEPVKGIARILAQLITVTWTSLAEQGKTAPPGVVVQAAMVVAQAVGEMAVRLRLIPEQGNGDVIESAFMLAMGEFGKATAQQMPPEHRQRYAQLLGAIRDGREQSMEGQRPQAQQDGQPPAQGAPQPPQPGNPQGGM